MTARLGAAKPPVRSAMALCVKELIWKTLIRFSPRKPPIALYASRRSGSTLLMEVIAVNAGVMFSDQPFSLFTASSTNLNRLPIFPYGQLANPDPQEAAYIEDYTRGLLDGTIRANVPWKVWSSEFHFRNDRICLKITDAKALIDWIDQHFEVQTVVSTRHPIAQSLSVANLGWMITGKGFLRNAAFVRQWLSSELEQLCWEVYGRGTELEQRVVDWALENLPMLTWLKQRSHWSYLSYEELIAETEAAIDYLADRLQLADRAKMIGRVSRPSRSTRRESTAQRKSLIRSQDRNQLIDSWQKKVESRELDNCFRILDRFGIGLYRPDRSMPDRAFLGRPRLGGDPRPAPKTKLKGEAP